MKLYKIDPVDELYRRLNEVAQNIYKQAGMLAAAGHLLDELAQSKDMDFEQLQTCRCLLQGEASDIAQLEHKLDAALRALTDEIARKEDRSIDREISG